ncbi:hypothetical protein ACSBR2_003203 [Camellia fascicularis]
MSIHIPSFGSHRSNIYDPFSFEVWDPLTDSYFQSPFNGHPPPFPINNETLGFINAKIDWKETPGAHVFIAELPGLKRDEVKVQVEEDRVLKISGERNLERGEREEKKHRVERSSGKFMRMFRLPENARVDQLKAFMHDGVLTVIVPKGEVKKSCVRTVQIG